MRCLLVVLSLCVAAPSFAQLRASRLADADLQQLRAETSSAQRVGAAGVPGARVELSAAVTVAPNEFLAVRTNRQTEVSVVADRAIGRLPIDLVFPSTSGEAETLEIKFESAGLLWRPQAGRFVGELLLGVVGRDAPNVSGDLPTHVQMQIVAPSGSDASPADVSIRRKGIPFERIELASDMPTEPFNLRVLASFDPLGADIPVAVRRPSLQLFVAPAVINGFGLETAELTVTTSEGAAAAGALVIITPTRGRATETRLVLDDNGVAKSTIRSDGTGTIEIVAASEPFVRASQPLEFRMPTAFLAAVGIGTMLGSAVWTYVMGTGRRRARKKLFGDWAVGAVAGFGLTIAVFGRIDLSDYLPFLPADLGSEVTAFGVAFVVALVGVSVSKALIKNASGDRVGD